MVTFPTGFYNHDNPSQVILYTGLAISEPLPGVLGNTGTVAFIFREQGIFSNYFQGTGELLTRLLGSFLGTRGFSNGEQGIKSKKVKGSWEHAPPPGRGSFLDPSGISESSRVSSENNWRWIPFGITGILLVSIRTLQIII